jgi:peptidoglycan hydrolase CwlO-like protein
MSFIRKIIGLFLIVAAVGGLIFSIAGLVLVWRVESQVTAGMQNFVDVLSQTLQTTSQGLTITQQALKSSVDTVSSLQTTVQTTAKTIKSSGPMVDEISKLMTKDLPNTVKSTEASLRTAQESAKVIDSVLSTLSSIPLIGSSIGYNPQVPLDQALGQVADSLTNLPDSFANMADSLKTSSSNLETFQADLTVMAASIGEIEKSVAQYESVVSEYQKSLDNLNSNLSNLKGSLPNIVRSGIIGLTIFLVWMVIVQFGLFTQGLELMFEEAPVRKKEPEKEASEG